MLSGFELSPRWVPLTRKRDQTRGSGGMLPRENFIFKSSEMAINASKTAISNINL